MNKNMLLVDGLQYVNWNRDLFEKAQSSGLSAIHVTIAYWENIRETLENIGNWNQHFINHADLIMPIHNAADILEAKRLGKVGIIFGFQNCSPIEDDVKMVQLQQSESAGDWLLRRTGRRHYTLWPPSHQRDEPRRHDH